MSLGVWDVNHFGAVLLGLLRAARIGLPSQTGGCPNGDVFQTRRYAQRDRYFECVRLEGDLPAADPKSTAPDAEHMKDSDRGEPKWSVQSPNCLAGIFARYQGRPEIGRLSVMAAWTKTGFSPWFVRFGGQT